MRIIAGRFRGKKLTAPTGLVTRPTSDRARESLFNILDADFRKNEKSWLDIVFMDVFAGSGAIGLEAASRGAKHVYFVENNRSVLKVLKENCADFINTTLIVSDARMLSGSVQKPDVLFMDAPYGQNLWQEALTACVKNRYIDTATCIIIETDADLSEEVPVGFQVYQDRSYGRNRFLFLKYTL